MRWHAFHFSMPLNDDKALRWIERTARGIEKKYPAGA